MLTHLIEFPSRGHGWNLRGIHRKLNKFFPDVVNRLIRGVDHVLLIKTIVAELVKEDFVGGEIMDVRERPTNLIHGQQQGGLAQLVLVETILEMAQGGNRKDELLVGKSVDQIRKQVGGGLGIEECPIEATGGKFVTVGNHRFGDAVTKNPRRTETDDDPLGLKKMRMSLDKMGVHLINKDFLGRTPEIRVMVKSAVVALAYLDNLVMTEGLATLQAKEGDEHTKGIVECTKRIYLGVETQIPTNATYLVGKTGTQEKQAIAIDNGLGERGDIDRSGKVHLLAMRNRSTSMPAMAPVPAATMA